MSRLTPTNETKSFHKIVSFVGRGFGSTLGLVFIKKKNFLCKFSLCDPNQVTYPD